MADVEDGEEPCALSSHSGSAGSKSGGDKMFSLKKWNAVAMWSWDVECDTCAICRVQVMDVKLKTNKRIVLSGTTKVVLTKCCKQFKGLRTAVHYGAVQELGPPHHSQILELWWDVPKHKPYTLVWGECNHSFHNCCMSLWVKQNNRCPLCQQDWVVQRIGK
ncbi:hypothetical protein QTO34_007066 [Cnephaeus nilssonii]|uniref:cullin-RING-type E3 NEDD8 transferase n=1 Tax=Cnephaeus nilssonii TaxID=3371016 RepID=A0AA40HKN5_CNENI|nr:hypothetical protein QTO34_007066 [Eptesicus nilssonii]